MNRLSTLLGRIRWRNFTQVTAMAALVSLNASSQITWHLADAPEQWNDYECLVYGGGKFVAIAGSLGTNRIIVSEDGNTWAGYPAPANNVWQGLCYGNGKFVAVAGSGSQRVMTSSDGTNWSLQDSPSANWMSVAYGNNTFVAVAIGGQVMYSADGVDWTEGTAASPDLWQNVEFGNGLFVAYASLGSSNLIMTSPDGVNWTNRSAPINNWLGSVYGDKWVGVGQIGANNLLTSSDGVSWTSASSGTMGGTGGYDITYGNGTYVAVGGGSNDQRIWMSLDGVNWTFDSSPISGTPYDFTAIEFGNGCFVAVSNDGGSPYGTRKILTSCTATASSSENIAPSGVSIVPNPFKESTTISNLQLGDNIRIFDMYGKLVFETTAREPSLNFDLSSIGSGVYTVVVSSRKRLINKRLIKE